MLKPNTLSKGDIMAMDRAYIDYAKFQQLTERGVIYVTKMKKNLKYSVLSDTMYQTPDGLMEVRIQNVEFVKQIRGGETIHHKSRIITYVDAKSANSYHCSQTIWTLIQMKLLPYTGNGGRLNCCSSR